MEQNSHEFDKNSGESSSSNVNLQQFGANFDHVNGQYGHVYLPGFPVGEQFDPTNNIATRGMISLPPEQNNDQIDHVENNNINLMQSAGYPVVYTRDLFFPVSPYRDQFDHTTNNHIGLSNLAPNYYSMVNRRNQHHPQARASFGGSNEGDQHVNQIDEYFLDMPPGIRFCPSDEELAWYFLKKINHEPLPKNLINEVRLYDYHPRDLTAKYKPFRENSWYFFTPREKKYPNGIRPNRTAALGYWKPIGTENNISGDVFKQTVDYYQGKQPTGERTDWKMIEYYRKPSRSSSSNNDGSKLDDALCKIYKKREGGGAANANPEDSTASQHENDILQFPNAIKESASTSMPLAMQGNEFNQLDTNAHPLNIHNKVQEEPTTFKLANATEEGSSTEFSNHTEFSGPSSSMQQENDSLDFQNIPLDLAYLQRIENEDEELPSLQYHEL